MYTYGLVYHASYQVSHASTNGVDVYSMLSDVIHINLFRNYTQFALHLISFQLIKWYAHDKETLPRL